MVEELGSIVRNGFDTWKKNLAICLPFVFSFILAFIVAVIIIGGAILVAVGPLLPYLTDPGEIPPEVIPLLLLHLLQHIEVIIAAVIITIILVLLISAFFAAGAIGMAKEATKKGRTNLSDMIDHGRRKFISLLFATIIVGLIALAGVVFLIPGVMYMLPAITSKTPPDVTMAAITALLLVLGYMIMLIYMLIVSIMFALTPYAVVIDDVGAIEGVKSGFKYFMAHKLDVFLLWLILLAIAMVNGTILGIIPYIGLWISLAVAVIIIAPLSAIWWSRLYLSMKEPTGV